MDHMKVAHLEPNSQSLFHQVRKVAYFLAKMWHGLTMLQQDFKALFQLHDEQALGREAGNERR